jgi:hypothetical protein
MPRKGRYKHVLATITAQALDKIIGSSVATSLVLRLIMAWVERERRDAINKMDKARQARINELGMMVGKLALELADIEREARVARDGRIEDQKEEDTP